MLHVQAACGLSSRRQLSAAKSIRPERTLAIQSQRSSFNGNQGTIFFQFPRSFTAQAVTAKKAASAAVSDAPHAEVLADTVLVVESKTKANKIQNYLGPSYKVLESQGHIRDLDAKEGSVDTDDDFRMTWVVDDSAQVRLDRIENELKQDGIIRFVLATDPDREGEAIAWHLTDILQDALQGKQVQRITFTEVSQKAVEAALANPRQVDSYLVDAYKARRTLDYLLGYGISPILWTKLGGAKSAGRVQSVALRLLTEQEDKITAFQSEEWWTVDVTLTNSKGNQFKAEVTRVDGEQGQKFDLKAQVDADALARRISDATWQVTGVKSQDSSRGPSAPYMTSTMLMDAANQLGSNVAATMAAAQGLFEGDVKDTDEDGLISYMRTDSPALKEIQADMIWKAVQAIWGEDYLAEKPKLYMIKNKNAQEGHTAIIPNDPMQIPDDVFKLMKKVKGAYPTLSTLTARQRKLYELIWRRALASQMSNSKLKRVTVDIASTDGKLQLRADAVQVLDAGFLRAFDNFDPGKKDKEGEDEEEGMQPPSTAGTAEKNRLARLLSNLQEGEPVRVAGVPPKQHFTKAPPRFSEANLVKTLQEKGIGRPSTYGAIITGLQERGYVVKEGRGLKPAGRGKLVISFLKSHFAKYLDYDYTSDMESQLDEIAGGRADHLQLLHNFWPEFNSWTQAAKAVSVRDVVTVLDAAMAPIFFPLKEGQTEEEVRTCPACAKRGQQGRLGLKPTKTSAAGFIGCSNYPDCNHSQPLEALSESIYTDEELEGTFPGLSQGPVSLGYHPKTAESVLLRCGQYGLYLQVGTDKSASAVDTVPKASRSRHSKQSGKSVPRPRTLSLQKDEVEGLDLAKALELLKWPVHVGDDPSGQPVHVHKGKFNYYVKRGGETATVPADVDLNCVDLEDALEILAAKLKTKDKRAGKSKAALKRPSAALQKDLSTLEELKPRGDSEPDDRNGQAQTASTNKTPLELADASQAPAGDNGEEGKGKPKATKPKGKAVAGSKPKVPAKGGKSIVKMASKSKSKTVSKSKNKGKAESSSAGTPKTGYRLFWRQQWDKLKSDDPNIHMTDATKQIANVWQSMDAEAKEQFK